MSSTKLESDYQTLIKKTETQAAVEVEKIRSDLEALKIKAKNYPTTA